MGTFCPRLALLSSSIFVCFAAGCSGCDLDLWEDDDPDECSSDDDCFGTKCQLLNDGNRCEPDCSRDEDCDCGERCNYEGECEQDQLVNPCPLCAEVDDVCAFDSDCCSGHCGDLGSCEAEPLPVCIRAGEACSAEEVCCAGVCAGGTCAAQKCQPNGEPEVVAVVPAPGALSASANALYWVSEGALRSIPKVGGEVTVLAGAAGAGSCIARFGNRTSWCGDDGDIWRLVDGEAAPSLYAVAPAAVSSLIDSDAGLFWSDVDGAIMAAPAPLPSQPLLLAMATSAAPAIAVDASSLFYADGPTIETVPIGGGAISPFFVGDPGGAPIAALAGDETRVYFVHGLEMKAVAKSDGAATALGFAETARLIALSETDVFYADTFIGRVSKAGGETVALVHAVAPPSLLADEQCVYWVDPEDGRILKVSSN